MRRIAVLVMLVLGPAPMTSAGAELSPEVTGELTAAFDALGFGEDVDTANSVAQVLLDTSMSDQDWQAFFRSYYKTHLFTPDLARFWDHAIAGAGEAQERSLVLSGLCAAEAAASRLPKLRPGVAQSDYDSLDAALAWLQHIAPGLPLQGPEMVLEALAQGPKAKPADLVPLLAIGARTDPGQVRLAMQLCLTLGEYAHRSPGERARIDKVVRLPESTGGFWQAHGLFLFEGGSLDPHQLASLDNLVTLIPRDLHAVAALIVPEAVGLDTANPGLATTGQLVYIPAIPMDLPTNPSEFTPRVGQPIAPEFTIVAAQQMIRAVQTTQFQRRPQLVARRDVILANARNQRERYLRRFIPPAVYLEDPDELLPAIAYLWFIDSYRTFRMALDLLELEQGEAMDSFLLFADLMSAGGGTTLLYATSPGGELVRSETPIGRTHLDVIRMPVMGPVGITKEAAPLNVDCVTAIFINGRDWHFELGDSGQSIRWHLR